MATRPTAVNLRWALDDMRARPLNQPRDMRMGIACARAAQICDEEAAMNSAIGDHGLALTRAGCDCRGGQGSLTARTQCNAAWRATGVWCKAPGHDYLGTDPHPPAPHRGT